MKIAIGADHAGYPAKAPVKEVLEAQGHEVVDLGAHAYDALWTTILISPRPSRNMWLPRMPIGE